MELVVTIVHYFLCFFLMIVILLQAGKGADIGAAFGAGSSQTLFGPRGAATFLNKLTSVVAVAFLVTSLSLSEMSKTRAGKSVFERVSTTPKTETAPTEPPLTTPETQK
ncbi:MAG: preprotein translocase subunit SecG [Candidatus Omnitrophota bacterium]